RFEQNRAPRPSARWLRDARLGSMASAEVAVEVVLHPHFDPWSEGLEQAREAGVHLDGVARHDERSGDAGAGESQRVAVPFPGHGELALEFDGHLLRGGLAFLQAELVLPLELELEHPLLRGLAGTRQTGAASRLSRTPGEDTGGTRCPRTCSCPANPTAWPRVARCSGPS